MPNSKIGIAGVDENKRYHQATGALGIAGETKDKTLAGARFGASGLNDRRIIEAGGSAFGISGIDRVSKCAVAGVNTRQIESAAMGVAGNLGSAARQGASSQIVDAAAFKQRDAALASISKNSNRLGDRAAREAWQRGVWFADFTYIAKARKGIAWREGREAVFSRATRDMPLFIDSCGYRRELSKTAPAWAHNFDVYPQAIELLNPDGYASWDYPTDRARSMESLRRLMNLFPQDLGTRMWPIFSARWAWADQAAISYDKLPGWTDRDLGALIPVNKTQKPFPKETREGWARAAIANALLTAQDPDFRFMVETFGKVMIGGMVKGPCPRMARHLYAATLCKIFPEVQFWLLGQANFAVVNGLGMLGLLDQVWTDGSWWIKDSTAERFAVVEDGLITMFSLESNFRLRSFFTLIEMMAANLRSLLAAYEGLWSWPPPEPLPLDLMDIDQVVELKARMQYAQLELGL